MTFTISLGWWLVPATITAALLGIMCRRDHETGGGTWASGIGDGFEALLRLLWLIPILFVWLVYFIIATYSSQCY